MFQQPISIQPVADSQSFSAMLPNQWAPACNLNKSLHSPSEDAYEISMHRGLEHCSRQDNIRQAGWIMLHCHALRSHLAGWGCSCAICMRMTASSTSLTARSVARATILPPAPTPTSFACWTSNKAARMCSWRRPVTPYAVALPHLPGSVTPLPDLSVWFTCQNP